MIMMAGFIFNACDLMNDIFFEDEPEGKVIKEGGLQEARCAIETDNGYIIVGFDSTSEKGQEVFLIKLNKKGKIRWKKRYGGPGSEYGRWIEKTSDGNYIVCGSTDSYSGNPDVYLLKINPNGDTLWTRFLSLGSSESGYCVRQEPAGNFVIIGNRGNDMLLAKTNPEGQLLWHKTFGGSDEDQGECLLINPAGEYILLGETQSYGLSKSDFFVVKTDADGNTIWNYHHGGSGYNHGFSMDFAADSGYILAGTTRQTSTSEGEATLIQINDHGDTVWTYVHNKPNYNVRSVCKSTDGNYVFTGWTSGLFKSIYLIKMRPDREFVWTRTYASGLFDGPTQGYHVLRTSDKEYLVTGILEKNGTDVLAVKTNSKGSPSW